MSKPKSKDDDKALKLRTYQGVDGLVAYAPDGRTWRCDFEAGRLPHSWAPIGIREAWAWDNEGEE